MPPYLETPMLLEEDFEEILMDYVQERVAEGYEIEESLIEFYNCMSFISEEDWGNIRDMKSPKRKGSVSSSIQSMVNKAKTGSSPLSARNLLNKVKQKTKRPLIRGAVKTGKFISKITEPKHGVPKDPYKTGFNDLDEFLHYWGGKISNKIKQSRQKKRDEVQKKSSELKLTPSKVAAANKPTQQRTLKLDPQSVATANKGLNKKAFLKKSKKPIQKPEPVEKIDSKKTKPSSYKDLYGKPGKATKDNYAKTGTYGKSKGMTKQKLLNKVSPKPKKSPEQMDMFGSKPKMLPKPKSPKQKEFDGAWKAQKAQNPKQKDMFGKSPKMLSSPEPVKKYSTLKIKPTGKKTSSGKPIFKKQ